MSTRGGAVETGDLNAGSFRPVTEEVTLDELVVEGAIPRDLNGMLVRNGPNPAHGRFAGNDTFSWFVGDGMLHGVRLEDGEARGYRNRWVRTELLAANRGADVEPDSPANTSVRSFGGRLLALCEGAVPYEVDGGLGTIGPYDFGGRLPGGHMTAHPKVDPLTGDMVAFDYDWQPPFLRYFVARPDGQIAHAVEIPTRGPTMMHDFAVTASRSVFLELPIVFDVALAQRGLKIPYRWDEGFGARIGVIPRFGTASDVAWFEIAPCFVFHTMNAFDRGETVVVDAVRYARSMEYDFEAGRFLPDTAPGVLTRYELDLRTGTVGETVLDERSSEFPRTADAVVGREHRFGYTVAYAEDGVTTAGLVKHDLASGTRVRWRQPEGLVVSEPVFVPSGEGSGEDEGYLLHTTYDLATDTSSVDIRDATDLQAPAVARIRLPVRIPRGFHGDWIAADALSGGATPWVG